MGAKLISITSSTVARVHLAAHLREEAAATRAAAPPDPPSPTGHQIDRAGMLEYADLCEEMAADLADLADDAYAEIRAERERQIAKGRDAFHDDGRWWSEWLACFETVAKKREDGAYGPGDRGWRTFWIKVGSIAVAAVESHDRRAKS